MPRPRSENGTPPDSTACRDHTDSKVHRWPVLRPRAAGLMKWVAVSVGFAVARGNAPGEYGSDNSCENS